MKVRVFIYVLEDSYGNKKVTVANDPCDRIIIGACDSFGEYQQFESEAYHLANWAVEHNGFVVVCHEKEIVV